VLSLSTAIFCSRGGDFLYLFGGKKRQTLARGHRHGGTRPVPSSTISFQSRNTTSSRCWRTFFLAWCHYPCSTTWLHKDWPHTGRPKQTTPCKITPAAAADDRPTLSVAALLQIVAWYRQRRALLHGGDPCPAGSNQSPPRQPQQAHCLALSSLWQALPNASRLQALQVLSRVLAQQLPAPPPVKEVTHEQD
jgi:hypothetical protein